MVGFCNYGKYQTFFDELSILLYQKENYFKNEDGYNVSNIDYVAEQKCEQRMLKKLYSMDQATRGIYARQVVREVSILPHFS